MNKQEIIIVDDNDLLTFLHSEIVSMAGYGENTPSFAHGKLAYDYLVERKGNEIPLLILLDINMPVMNGWDMLDVLPNIEKNENIYVAIVTSSVDMEDRNKAFSYPHVIDFLEKPITEESIEKVVRLMHDKAIMPLEEGLM